LSEDPAYIHLTSNNTIFGTQWASFPDYGKGRIIADMSSDILSRVFDVSRFGLIYAGAQKNLGPAGATLAIISPEMLEACDKSVPTMLKYGIHAKNNSLYNTPPVIAVYVIGLVLKWMKELGGLSAVEAQNREKAKLIYDAIDNSAGFYKGHAEPGSRSIMNVTFRLSDEELEAEFAAKATKEGLVGLKGHRSVGGMRASIYNAMPVAGCKTLASFMNDFARR
jgi:phosphoserine aminotransferase